MRGRAVVKYKKDKIFKIISICKGGGYKYCRTEPLHPNRNSKGLYTLHRVLLENKLGRLLTKKEIAHHKDGDKTNDNPKNIVLMSLKDHSSEHAKIRKVDDIKLLCPICNKKFELKPTCYRRRMKRSLSKMLGCSRQCGCKIGHLLKIKLCGRVERITTSGSYPLNTRFDS